MTAIAQDSPTPEAATMSPHARRYVRTEAGKAEVLDHRLPLPRPTRNMLMVIDAGATGVDWIARVHGATAADLDNLVAHALVAVTDLAPDADGPQVSVEQAVRGWNYDALYKLLTQEARERFGLLKGLRLILKIEMATDAAAMQALALDFAERLRQAHGEHVAARFRARLGATQ